MQTSPRSASAAPLSTKSSPAAATPAAPPQSKNPKKSDPPPSKISRTTPRQTEAAQSAGSGGGLGCVCLDRVVRVVPTHTSGAIPPRAGGDRAEAGPPQPHPPPTPA